MCFPVNFAKFLRTPFLTEHLWATASVTFLKNLTFSYDILKSVSCFNSEFIALRSCSLWPGFFSYVATFSNTYLTDNV